MTSALNTTDIDWYSSSATEKAKKAAAEKSSSTVSYDDFLKLLVTQLTNQDPLKPMEDIDFTGQLAQLQGLEEQIKLNDSFKAMRTDSQLQAASNLIGYHVVGDDDQGQETSGVVQKTTVQDSQVYLILDNNRKIAVDKVSSTASVVNQSDLMASAGSLVGMFLRGYAEDGTTATEGIVQKAVLTEAGAVALQLHGGKTVPMHYIEELRVPTEDETWYYLPDDIREQANEAKALVDQHVTVKTVVDGKVVEESGVVKEAFLDGDKVKLALHNGFTFTVADVMKYHAPTADELQEAADSYVGQYYQQKNEDGTTVEGIVASAGWASAEDMMYLTLHDGTEVALGDATVLRAATDEEKAKFPAGADAGSGGTAEEP